ncbi:MAG: MerR family transcriptional regulator [Chloroflexales bacterium]|nr:MerR family transcriptional regulator [Chloroflexales bacterium]
MLEETQYTIGELAERAGVTSRTIRYYTAEGLLPPPDARGRYALYGSDHLVRLRLIARLKDAYLPLSEIKARLAKLTTAQVQQLLDAHNQDAAPNAPSSAADYVAQVLAQQRPSAAPPAPMLGYHTPGAAEPPRMQVRQVDPATTISVPEIPQRSMTPPFQLGRVELPTAEPAPSTETWQRIVLRSGLELHIREPLTPELQDRIERLIELTHTLFDDE